MGGRIYRAITATLIFGVATLAHSSAHGLANDDCEFMRQGASVRIPPGTFICRRPIVIKNNGVELIGAGRDLTILKLADHSESPLVVIGDDEMAQAPDGEWVPATRVADVRLANLTIDGNVANQDVSKECGQHGCDEDVASIRNNAITVRGASRITIENVTAKNAISGGLVTEKHCDHLIVRDFASTGNHFDGLAGYQTEDSLFENIELSHNRSAGISLDIDFNNNIVRGGRLEQNGDVGIFARDVKNLVFEKLEIIGSGSHGVFLADAGNPSANCAVDNEFRSVLIQGSKGYGFYLGGPCGGNKLTEETRLIENQRGCEFVVEGGRLERAPSVVCR